MDRPQPPTCAAAAALRLLLIITALLTPCGSVQASYAIYVGAGLTADGSVLLGGSGDEVSGHWLEIVAAEAHGPDDRVSVGVDDTALLPGELISIPQVPSTYRYLTMNYSEYEGFPPPLTNGGLNEHGVAARDVWAPSRDELIDMTPVPQRGLNYSDLARLAMQRARSAREAAALVGELIERHGYATYGGNTHLFADAREGWVVMEFAGGQGLWVAERLGRDEVRMLYPGYIDPIPLDYADHPDYMGAPHLIEFAEQQGWFDREGAEHFDVMAAYATDERRVPVDEFEAQLAQGEPVTLRRMLDTVRDPRVSKDATGYGQVARLRVDTPADQRILWTAPTGAVTAPFLPWRLGVQRVPPEFGRHRYLAKGEASRYLTRDWQIQEATEFAGRLFKRLMYYTCDRPQEFLPEVTRALAAFEDRLIEEQAGVDATMAALTAQGRPELAAAYVTDYLDARADAALQLGAALLTSIEARTEVQYGLRAPQGEEMSRLDYQMIKCLP